MNILVSSCILGIFSRYDGQTQVNESILPFIKEINFIPVCPEQLGGLPTPRPPCEILNGRVVTPCGSDETDRFLRGAEETLKIAKMFDCRYAVLKDRSPSCGEGIIYDGTFTGKRITGDGVTAKYLKENGITVIPESKAFEFLRKITDAV